MAKKKVKKTVNAKSLMLVFLVSILLILIAGFHSKVFGNNFLQPGISASQKQPISSKSIASQSISPSATPKPSPKIMLPSQSGRQMVVPILTYHYIGNNPNPADRTRDNLSTSPDKFEEQMAYISKNGYNTISLDTIYAVLKGQASLPAKPIVLTFDDGYIDFYVNAFPVLRKYNLHATAFISTGLIDQGYYMHWNQIKEIDASGLISFEAHSVNHINLNSLTSDQLRYQLSQSKKTIQDMLGKPVNFMAYPYGISNEAVWQAVKDAGYLGAAGTWYGSVISEGTIFDMPRIKISGGITIEDFAKKI